MSNLTTTWSIKIKDLLSTPARTAQAAIERLSNAQNNLKNKLKSIFE